MSPGMTRLVLGFMAVMFAVVAIGEWNKYSALAAKGKEALATVVSYNPEYTYSRHGRTTHHWHVLSFNNMEQRVELERPHQAGESFKILYLPDKPSTACEGTKGMNVFQLMGTAGSIMFVIFTAIALFMGWAALFPNIKMNVNVNTNIRTVPGTQPQQVSATAAQEPTQGKYPEKTMNAAYTVRQEMLAEPARFANMRPADAIIKITPASDSDAAGAYELAKKLEFDASEEADNIVDGLYTRDQAAANLARTNPGFSTYVYIDILEKEIEKVRQ